MALSVFDDKAMEPTEANVAEVLGDASHLWTDLRALMASEFDPMTEDWVYSGKKWGWALRLKHKKRAILYMTPSTGFFFAGFALGEKAVAATHTGDLPQSLLEIINGSQKYAEGRGVRLEVWSAADLENVIKLAAIKMAN